MELICLHGIVPAQKNEMMLHHNMKDQREARVEGLGLEKLKKTELLPHDHSALKSSKDVSAHMKAL